jgi:hypothetical protein
VLDVAAQAVERPDRPGRAQLETLTEYGAEVMQHSEQIDQLATALAAAQGVMGGALKDSANPFFKSKYADLESVWTACRKALSENGLAVIQTTGVADSGGVCVTTVLAHKSGQWIRDTLPVNAKDNTPQGIGSAITYARRYALASIVGVYQTDDDAEAAHGRGTQPQQQDDTEARLLASNFMAALKAGVDGKVAEVHDQANADQELYQAAWKLIPAGDRREIKAAIDRVKSPRKERANA